MERKVSKNLRIPCLVGVNTTGTLPYPSFPRLSISLC